jgi:hypothetical protein
VDKAGVEGGCADPDPEFMGGGVLPEGVEGPREPWARRGVVGRWLLLGPTPKIFKKNIGRKKKEIDACLQLTNLQLNHRWKSRLG